MDSKRVPGCNTLSGPRSGSVRQLTGRLLVVVDLAGKPGLGALVDGRVHRIRGHKPPKASSVSACKPAGVGGWKIEPRLST